VREVDGDAGILRLARVGVGQAVAAQRHVGGDDDLLRAHPAELGEQLVTRAAEADLERPRSRWLRRRAEPGPTARSGKGLEEQVTRGSFGGGTLLTSWSIHSRRLCRDDSSFAALSTEAVIARTRCSSFRWTQV
jgi:hypothetical protein